MTTIVGRRNEAILEQSAQDFGVACSITVAEDPKSTVRWELLVDVQVPDGGRMRLGRVLTIPPGFLTVPYVSSRIVAFAYCPGATQWMIQAIPTQLVPDTHPNADEASCEVVIATSKCCPGMPMPGVYPTTAYGAAGVDPDALFVDATHIALVNATTTLIVGEDETRRRVVLQNDEASGGAIYQITTNPAGVIGFSLHPGQTFETTIRRPIYGYQASGSPKVVSYWAERM